MSDIDPTQLPPYLPQTFRHELLKLLADGGLNPNDYLSVRIHDAGIELTITTRINGQPPTNTQDPDGPVITHHIHIPWAPSPLEVYDRHGLHWEWNPEIYAYHCKTTHSMRHVDLKTLIELHGPLTTTNGHPV